MPTGPDTPAQQSGEKMGERESAEGGVPRSRRETLQITQDEIFTKDMGRQRCTARGAWGCPVLWSGQECRAVGRACEDWHRDGR